MGLWFGGFLYVQCYHLKLDTGIAVNWSFCTISFLHADFEVQDSCHQVTLSSSNSLNIFIFQFICILEDVLWYHARI